MYKYDSQQNQYNQQQQHLFQQARVKLGYKIQDIIPVDIVQVENQSKKYTSQMKQKQKQFYIVRKAQALQQRRQKILKEIDQQVLRMKRYTVQRKNRTNPIVMKLLHQHQKMCHNKLKYLDKLENIQKKRKDMSYSRQSDKRSIDLGRTSPVSFQRMNQRTKTRSSANSAKGSRLSMSSAKSQRLKQKLKAKKEKDAQIQKFKKQMLQRKTRQSQRRILKVQHQVMNKSRKAKTRSQISQQIVQQKKKEIDAIDYCSKRQHVQRLRNKIQRGFETDVLKKLTLKRKIDFPYQKMKRDKQQDYQQNIRQMHEHKMQKAQQRKKMNDFDIKYTIDIHRSKHQQKQRNIKQNIKFRNEQQKLVKLQVHQKFNRSLDKAKQFRQRKQQQLRTKLLESRVKEEVAKMNKQTIQQRKKINTQNKMRSKSQKYQELSQIQSFKRMLRNDRNKLEMNMKLNRLGRYPQTHSNSIHQSFNLYGISWSNKNQTPYSSSKQNRYSFAQ